MISPGTAACASVATVSSAENSIDLVNMLHSLQFDPR
jgi:hypothetical protein